MRPIANLEELNALIVRYKSITLKEINSAAAKYVRIRYYGEGVANYLTGFGGLETCPLCTACDLDCDLCVHGRYGCSHHHTYRNIFCANNNRELWLAFRKRARYLKGLSRKYSTFVG